MTDGISAIVTAYERVEQTLATLERIQSCEPGPNEILVHVDGDRAECEQAIRSAFPDIRLLRSRERVGPGGGRNKLIAAASFELVASFDDDSYPIDADYFERALQLCEQYPAASVISAALFHAGETIAPARRRTQWTADFPGGACIFRRTDFLETGGYVPLPVAYGMEEVDLSLRLHARGGKILTSEWLRVFHNTDRLRHADPRVTAGSIANLALLAYLRYPAPLWSIGLWQCTNRVFWLLRNGRRRGIWTGVTMIPAHLRANQRYRAPLSVRDVRSYLALRRGHAASMSDSSRESSERSWICCQLGAREHYAIPRALQLNNQLREFITDLWIRPGALTRRWQNKLAGRFHPGLAKARVTAPNVAALAFEFKAYAAGVRGWDLIGRRNDWFQDNVLVQLQQPREASAIFAYSYAADRIFKFARERGWRTVLGQIDPGPADEHIIARLHASTNGWRPAPRDYWRRWRTECELADEILVNSSWTRDALMSEGIAVEKIRVVPLAFEPGREAQTFERGYPQVFTTARPLRVLFLGQINLRKGAQQLFDAARLLANEPIEFWFVGPRQISIPSEPRIKWFGVAPRTKVDHYYRQADVFILPTHSDGFGLTQLEAQSWKLPVVATRFCGEVVQEGVNGVILKEVSGEAIADVLRELLRSPERLAAMSERSGVGEEFSLKTLAASLSSL